MNDDIKQILKMRGWEMIENILDDEVIKGLNTNSIDTKSLSPEQITIQVISAQIASEMVAKALLKIKQLGSEVQHIEPKKYI